MNMHLARTASHLLKQYALDLENQWQMGGLSAVNYATSGTPEFNGADEMFDYFEHIHRTIDQLEAVE